MGERSRELYDRFGVYLGAEVDERFLDPRTNEQEFFRKIFTFYLVWSVVGYLLTIRSSMRPARTWFTILIGLGLALEISNGLSQQRWMTPYMRPLLPIIPYLTEHALILSVRCLLAPLLSLFLGLADYFHTNRVVEQIQVMELLQQHQQVRPIASPKTT